MRDATNDIESRLRLPFIFIYIYTKTSFSEVYHPMSHSLFKILALSGNNKETSIYSDAWMRMTYKSVVEE